LLWALAVDPLLYPPKALELLEVEDPAREEAWEVLGRVPAAVPGREVPAAFWPAPARLKSFCTESARPL
jgi:hypothetical protein